MKNRLKKNRNDLRERMAEVDAEINLAEGEILGKLTPKGLFKEMIGAGGTSGSPVASTLVSGLSLGIRNPVARMALPVAANVVSRKFSDRNAQIKLIQGLRNALRWVSDKTELTLDDEKFLLSEEIGDIQNSIKSGMAKSEIEAIKPVEKLEEGLRSGANKDVPIQVEEASWY
ncbi:hypothetical protein [Jiulongibacter sediminis]|uniref:Uncharacterized protein n=1 Tax=Jiulongibacter sediminis TaxID=1605367 RepID=A0A0N8H992_9BACT|nr:hypothetical protein [Jiulongibacter sediminis]KPM46724.1 hypothetical protein AFM12_18295 [Jiulongibacter sediminis]TBX21630.1 hypothetical protein TK44_18300 [Jiulongibacter sediminis]